MDVQAYLNRIAVDEDAASLKYLTLLQQHHFFNVPFENLDIHHPNRSIVLDLKQIYKKVVTEKRGGFCFELNGIFYQLLTELGFRVDRIPAKVYEDHLDGFGPNFAHMALIVHLDVDYLVDVGFGESSRTPIRMPDGQTQDISGKYRVIHLEENIYDMQSETTDGWKTQYRFAIDPQPLNAFDGMCHYHQTSPKSHFTQGKVITLATDEGRITLTSKDFKTTIQGIKEEMPICSDAEFDELLKQHFDITLRS